MSWFNPTPEEAQEAYSHYRDQYYNAADQRNAAARQEQEYVSQRSACKTQISDLSRDKINFEKRLDGIKKIVKILEGNSAWLSSNVPDAINKGNKSLQKADNSYRKCIQVTGIPAASLNDAFNIKSLTQEPHSASALQALKNEAIRLQESIDNCKKQITLLNNQISTLNQNIRASQSIQSSCRNSMNSAAYEMNHYRNYLY